MNLHFCPDGGNVAGMAMNRSKKAITVIMLLVSILFGVEPAFAENDKKLAAELQRFEFFVNCQPVALLVEELPEDASKIPITRSDIIMAAESRLKSARIYSDVIRSPYLYINLNVVSEAFNLSVALRKNLYDPISQSWAVKTSWQIASTGTHGRNLALLLGAIDQDLDAFIVNYFRVNEKACERK